MPTPLPHRARLLPQDELAVALRRIADDNESGAISDVISESEQRRAALGHTCFFYGTA